MLKSIIFGTIGGVLGILIGAFWLIMLGTGPSEIVSSGGGAFSRMDGNLFVSLIFGGAVASIAGAVLVTKLPVVGGLLMLVAAVPTAFLFGFHFVTTVTGLPSAIAGVAALWSAYSRRDA